MVGWVKDCGGRGGEGGGRAKEKFSRFQASRGWHLWIIQCMQFIKLNLTVCGMLHILFTCRFSFPSMYMTVSPVFALRKIDCLTFQSAYPEHLVKSVIAFVYLALEETEGIAPGCRTGEIGHECH